MIARPPPPSPLRRFGQNFLADPRLAERLIEHFSPLKRDLVVEIGPGRGALTRPLSGRVTRLVALEIDARQVDLLRTTFAGTPSVEIRQADALQTDFSALAVEMGGPLRVIGNLPYNVGTAILRRLIGTPQILDMQFVLQKEVVDRLLARHQTKAYGALTVAVAWTMRTQRLMTLAPGAFWPRPKVTSAAVALSRREPAVVSLEHLTRLEGWVQRGFAHRRKMLANNLPERRGVLLELLEAHDLPRDVRAEAIPADTWLALAEQLERIA